MGRLLQMLWFASHAEEAVGLYTRTLPNSRIDRVATMPAESPSGPAGSVTVIDFTLMGQPWQAMEAGPLDAFNHAISMVVECDDQAEIDRLWGVLSEGGEIEQCGWLKDRYGLSWQIVPAMLVDLMMDSDRVRGKRVAEAMMGMVKLDFAELRRAYDG